MTIKNRKNSWKQKRFFEKFCSPHFLCKNTKLLVCGLKLNYVCQIKKQRRFKDIIIKKVDKILETEKEFLKPIFHTTAQKHQIAS